MNRRQSSLTLKYLGINTSNEAVIFMREDCHICRSEGFYTETRVKVTVKERSMIAVINTIEDDSNLLTLCEASLSHYAWHYLEANEGDHIFISPIKTIESLSYVRGKLYGNELSTKEINEIITDIVDHQYSDIDLTMFLSSIAGNRLSLKEILDLTNAMINTGECLTWPYPHIVDKHCVGGLPGNRTTLIIVPIVTAYGLIMPKTSSRAITSPAGTADTMEIFAPVNLDIKQMQRIVEKEQGCICWGGTVSLSPADDIIIRIEQSMDLDSEGQMAASIISKKISAGSSHLLIDIPVGPTAKVRSYEQANLIKLIFESIAMHFNLKISIMITDGSQPVGRGIGPALEARDVWQILSGDPNAPLDLKNRAIALAGEVLEFSPKITKGNGKVIATSLLENGHAFKKFQAICHAQGGLFDIPSAPFSKIIVSKQSGVVHTIDNRLLARLAKLAGAPISKSAGVDLLIHLHTLVEKGQPIFIIYAESQGALDYAYRFYLERQSLIIRIKDKM